MTPHDPVALGLSLPVWSVLPFAGLLLAIALGPLLASSFCEAEGADVAVLGGWGERRWDDLLGRSITGRLLEEGRRHLFLYM